MDSTTRPVPDALMFRDVLPGVCWDIKRVPEHKMAAHLEGGWHLLISVSQVRASDITETYWADHDKWRGLKERR